jgi:hypothetical protein
MKSPLFAPTIPTLVLATLVVPAAPAEPVITEFMAANSSALYDEDAEASDWIELHNPDALPTNLNGWFLTDSAKKKTKWALPAIDLPAGAYLVVFASGKDRRDPSRPLHTNFSLDAEGEYLALIRPDGVGAATEFAPVFPKQNRNVSFGVPRAASGQTVTGTATYLREPTPGAPNSPAMLVETVTFSRTAGPFAQTFSLELRGAGAGQQIRYALAAPGTVLRTMPELTSSSFEYRGPITINTTITLCAAVFSADGSMSGQVSSAHFVKLSPAAAAFSSALPVLVIDTLGTGDLVKDGVDHPSWLYAYRARTPGTSAFSTSADLATPITTSVRGASSASFPKKGHNLKLYDERGGPRAQPLLDLPADDTWALVAPWSFDLSYLNNAFVYGLSNRMGRWAPRTRFAEVFFSTDGGELDPSDYAGIYVITDRIERGPARVDLAEPSGADPADAAITGGYILKIDHNEGNDFSWNAEYPLSEDGQSSVILVSPQSSDATAAQREYIRGYVRRMEAALVADAATGWTKRTSLDYIDRASWVDHHLINTFACNPDALVRSAYFNKDRGGKLVAGPVWDFDRALGSYWDGRSFRWNVWSGIGGTDVWHTGWWGLLAQDPEFIQDWIDRWQSLRRTELSRDNLIAQIETLARTIGPAAAARDADRWRDNANPHGNYVALIEHLQNWVTQRAQWIDEQFVAPPLITRGTMLTFTAPVGTELAYTLDGYDQRSLGGNVAPTAQMISGPLVVPANANVHVRAYRASLSGAFPESPWSSAVGGERSSPLTPQSRLINLSARALVGTGENALMVGAVVADTTAKRYLSRAIGPGLTRFGASGVVPDPRLALHGSNGVELCHNAAWQTADNAADLPRHFKTVGAFPLTEGSADSALTSEMPAGPYTLQVTTPTGNEGIGLGELYELDTNGRTVNVSIRARIRPGDGALIGGFVVQGSAYKRILVRAVGPTLEGMGVSHALSDPLLTVYAGQTLVASNDRWSSTSDVASLEKAARAANTFPLPPNSGDAALLLTLPPGSYTVELKGKADTEGVALLEIYDVP